MNGIKTLCIVALFALAGTASAAPVSVSTVKSDVLAQGTGGPSGGPADCKKTPNDPRCKDKDYHANIVAAVDGGTLAQGTGAPPDCKKTPNDPRCKDKDKD